MKIQQNNVENNPKNETMAKYIPLLKNPKAKVVITEPVILCIEYIADHKLK